MKKLLAHIGVTLLLLTAALLAYYLLGLANDALLFTPVTVFPLFVALALAAFRYRFPYGIALIVLMPVLMVLVNNTPLDPTDTRFFLVLVVAFDLIFTFIVAKVAKKLIRNEIALPLASYLAGKLVTGLVLVFGVVPLLPLVNYRVVVLNYLWGSPLFSLLALALYGAATVIVMKKIWKGDEKHA